jgi:hypothetical protein
VPAARQGSRRSSRFARLERELITPVHACVLIAAFDCAAPARCGARSRTGGASLPAILAAECGRKTLIHPPQISGPLGPCPASRHPACRPTSRRRSSASVRVPARVVRRGRFVVGRWRGRRARGGGSNGLPSLCIGALIATFHRDAPARCGAFVDERRVIAATKTDAKRSSSRDGQC